MKILLTSFGIAQDNLSPLKSSNVGIRLRDHYSLDDDNSIFHLMPPVSMRVANNMFMPDYAALLLCDKILMDEMSYLSLVDQSDRMYTLMAEVMKSLHSEGFLQIEDFGDVLRSNQNTLRKMTSFDLTIFETWFGPMKKSMKIWEELTRRALSMLDDQEYERFSGLHLQLHNYTIADVLSVLRECFINDLVYCRAWTNLPDKHTRPISAMRNTLSSRP